MIVCASVRLDQDVWALLWGADAEHSQSDGRKTGAVSADAFYLCRNVILFSMVESAWQGNATACQQVSRDFLFSLLLIFYSLSRDFLFSLLMIFYSLSRDFLFSLLMIFYSLSRDFLFSLLLMIFYSYFRLTDFHKLAETQKLRMTSVGLHIVPPSALLC